MRPKQLRSPIIVALLPAVRWLRHRQATCQMRSTGLLSLNRYQTSYGLPGVTTGGNVTFRKVRRYYQAKEGGSVYFGLRGVSGDFVRVRRGRRLIHGCNARWIVVSQPPQEAFLSGVRPHNSPVPRSLRRHHILPMHSASMSAYGGMVFG